MTLIASKKLEFHRKKLEHTKRFFIKKFDLLNESIKLKVVDRCTRQDENVEGICKHLAIDFDHNHNITKNYFLIEIKYDESISKMEETLIHELIHCKQFKKICKTFKACEELRPMSHFLMELEAYLISPILHFLYSLKMKGIAYGKYNISR